MFETVFYACFAFIGVCLIVGPLVCCLSLWFYWPDITVWMKKKDDELKKATEELESARRENRVARQELNTIRSANDPALIAASTRIAANVLASRTAADRALGQPRQIQVVW